MEIIDAKKFLARAVLNGPCAGSLRLVDLTGEVASVVPFDVETAATVFIDGVVVLVSREEIASRFHCEDGDSALRLIAKIYEGYKALAGDDAMPILADWIFERGIEVLPESPSADVLAIDIC